MQFISRQGQDAWVVEEVFQRKKYGFFLDLAAFNGVSANNTLFLERELGWSGLAIEADPASFTKLAANRSCTCLPACVDETNRQVEYLLNGELGGIIANDTDNCPSIRSELITKKRAFRGVIPLATTTLARILDSYAAPSVIDYFSFDVEGAETRILRSFPFNKYKFQAMTIERPTPELNALLFRNGYVFVKNVRFESFYVHESLSGLDRLKTEPFRQVPPKDW